jgi:transcriptional regulator with XRE-family HTH domain
MSEVKEEKTIGEIIAEARKKAGLSLRTVSAKIPVKFPYLADIEKNRRNPSEKVIRELCNQVELNLDFDVLMAKAGRLGEETEQYIKETPAFGSLIRELAHIRLNEKQLNSIKPVLIDKFTSVKTNKK